MLDQNKFWSNNIKEDHGYNIDGIISLCWIWQGSKDKDGYGNIWYEYRQTKVHIVSYKLTHNTFTRFLMTLHKCNIKGCYNPDHLYQGNASQNAIDSVKAGTHARARKTHCVHGHEFTLSNTKEHTSKKGKFQRICLACTYVRNHS